MPASRPKRADPIDLEILLGDLEGRVPPALIFYATPRYVRRKDGTLRVSRGRQPFPLHGSGGLWLADYNLVGFKERDMVSSP